MISYSENSLTKSTASFSLTDSQKTSDDNYKNRPSMSIFANLSECDKASYMTSDADPPASTTRISRIKKTWQYPVPRIPF